MRPSHIAWAMAGLTIAALAVGIAVSGPDGALAADAPHGLLFVAEVIKLLSGGAVILLARTGSSGGALRLAGYAGGLLTIAAGLAGFAALAGTVEAALYVTPLALTGLALTAAWLVGEARALSSVMLAILASLLALFALAALAFPPAGLVAALLGLVCWSMLARRYAGR